jgi:hypothetical protein
MAHKIRFSVWQALPMTVGLCLLALFVFIQPALALTPIPTPAPQPGSVGLEATKAKAPPTQGATITTPGSGASFSTSPITVNGICPADLLVQVYDNGVMVGSVMCANGSFSIQVSLFAGTNELSASVFDDLGQTGPISNVVTITYTNTNFAQFGSLITLTTSYGRRSAPAGVTPLEWPLQLSGGQGPYAFSLDWGDGSKPDLKSQALSGIVTISHEYKNAGIYKVNVIATDVKGASAFLQVIAVSSGKVDASSSSDKDAKAATTTTVLWIPTVVALILQIPVFWLGRRSQLVSMRNKMLKERDTYKQK